MRERYDQLMYDFDVEKAKEVKNQILKEELGYTLFRYQSCNENNFNALENKKIWVASPKDFNDAFEFSCTIGNKEDHLLEEMGVFEQIPEAKELYLQKQESLKELIRYSQNEFGVCCFMEDKFSQLMWSHYADGHKGFCVEFSFDEERFNNFVYPICYRKEMVNIEMKSPKADFLPIMLTKSEDWAYEREWRLVFTGKDQGLHEAPKIKAVYLGAKIEEPDKRRISDICRMKGYEIYQMDTKYGKYQLEIK